ncbi:hypothetical protein D3C80_1375450 [compost metagenome]
MVDQILADQYVRQSGDQSGISAWPDRDPLIFPPGGRIRITRIDDDHARVRTFPSLLQEVGDATAAHAGFRRIVAEQHHQLAVGDIIRAVALLCAVQIGHGGGDLRGAVTAIAAEEAAAGVHQAIRHVGVGDIAAVDPGTVQHVHRFITVLRQGVFQLAADGIQCLFPTDAFEFTFATFADAFHRVIQTFRMIHAPTHGAAAQTGAHLMVAINIVARVVGFNPVNFVIAYV